MFFRFLCLMLATVLIQVADAQLFGNYGNLGAPGRPFQNQISNPGLPSNINPAVIAQEKAALNMGYGNPNNANGMAFPNMPGYNQELGSFNGGGLIVTSSSPIAASGMTVQSENLVVEGPLAVTGQLPFLGVVEVEGPLPVTGQGAVTYGCGNGNVGIVGENLNSPPEPSINGGVGINARNAAGFRMPGVGRPGLY